MKLSTSSYGFISIFDHFFGSLIISIYAFGLVQARYLSSDLYPF
jgi:hypothetical protein